MTAIEEWMLYTGTSHVSIVTLEWSEIMGGSYVTPDTAVRDRRQK